MSSVAPRTGGIEGFLGNAEAMFEQSDAVRSVEGSCLRSRHGGAEAFARRKSSTSSVLQAAHPARGKRLERRYRDPGRMRDRRTDSCNGAGRCFGERIGRRFGGISLLERADPPPDRKTKVHGGGSCVPEHSLRFDPKVICAAGLLTRPRPYPA